MRVAKYRHQWDMSLKDLAQCTGLSIRQIRDIESGRVLSTHIRADTVLRLARAFGVSVEDLLGEVCEKDDGSLLYIDEFVHFTPTDTQAD